MVALKTFNNLTEERKQYIILICLEEFALHDFQSASLSSIIKKLNLAKGSFYRYFENKKTLYYFLLDYCVQKRIENDSSIIKKPSSDFFELILQHLNARIHFDKSQPLLSAFISNTLNEKNSKDIGNIQLIRKQKALNMTIKLIGNFIEHKKLRNDIDTDIMAWTVVQTQLSIINFIEQRYQEDFRENIEKNKILHSIPTEEIMGIAKQFIEIQKNGLIKK